MLRRACWIMIPVLLSACSDPGGKLESKRSPIIGGTPAGEYPEAVLIDGGPDANNRIRLCSGALIAPRVVLTAGHCIDGLSAFQVTAPYVGGQMAMATGATFDYAGNGDTPNFEQHDVGVLVLDSPITLASYPALASAPVADGTEVVDVGRMDNGSQSSELFVSPPVSVTIPAQVPFDYLSIGVTEHGDSGGPAFVSGTHEIVAVTSAGDGTNQLLARVDLLHDWINQQIANAPTGGGAGGSGGGSGGSGDMPPGSAADLPSGMGGCDDPGKATVIQLILPCPQAADGVHVCRYILGSAPSVMTFFPVAFDVGLPTAAIANVAVKMDSTARLGTLVNVIADEYIGLAGEPAPVTPAQTGLTLSTVQVGCPQGGITTTPNGPNPPPHIVGTGPASLDFYPDDVGDSGHQAKLATHWIVPAGFGETELTITAPPSVSLLLGSRSPHHIFEGTTEIDFFFTLAYGAAPISTQITVKAHPTKGADFTLTVPLRVEATRPRSVVTIGGVAANGVVDFGTILPGTSKNHTVTITNTGPAGSRFRGNMAWQYSTSTSLTGDGVFSIVDVRGSGAACGPYLDLASGQSCNVTYQFLPPREGAFSRPSAIVDVTQNASFPQNGAGGSALVTFVSLQGSGCPRCGGATCVDLGSDWRNCGGCGVYCDPLVVGGAGTCVAGSCACPASAPHVCSYGDGRYCTNLQTANDACGTCGHHCIGGSCSGGACVCAAGFTQCPANDGTDSICTNVSNDAANCGGCGHACPSSQSCSGGVCGGCPVGWSSCGGICINTDYDDNNCGGCGRRCRSGTTCAGGACVRPTF